jgi:membrane protease YdiL (CAAX protease family)
VTLSTGHLSAMPLTARRAVAALAPSLGLGGLLVAAVWLRAVGTAAGTPDPITAGLLFGLGLLGIAAAGRVRSGAVPRATTERRVAVRGVGRAVAIGAAGGGALVVLALLGRTLAGTPELPPVIQADALLPWSIATVVVATGEEAVLRGALFDRLTRAAGLWPAILVTSLVFALIHVPFYGWRVVPLDFGVGIWFAGLRLASGGIVAPSIAHAFADLATWWL